MCRHFTLQQALSLNAGRRENLLCLGFSSPARKGWVLRQLHIGSHQPPTLWKICLSDRLRQSFFQYCSYSIMSALKSQMFFALEQKIFYCTKNYWQTGSVMLKWQQYWKRLWRKICLLKSPMQRAGGWCKPVRTGEMIWFLSRSCKRQMLSNASRMPALKDSACWSVKWSLWDNQGGTTDYVYSSLRQFCLRDFFLKTPTFYNEKEKILWIW